MNLNLLTTKKNPQTKIQILQLPIMYQTSFRPRAGEPRGLQISRSNWIKLEIIQYSCLYVYHHGLAEIRLKCHPSSNRTRLPTINQFTIKQIQNVFFENPISRFNRNYNIGRERSNSDPPLRKLRLLDWSNQTAYIFSHVKAIKKTTHF